MNKNDLHAAYLLHTRPYRDTSVLACFFTQEFGLIDAVVRGARSLNSKYGWLQLFTPLYISWYGKTDLVTLKIADARHTLPALKKEALFYGFYLNELLWRLLKLQDPHEELFFAYEAILTRFASNEINEAHLRIFEKELLSSLGYALELRYDAESGDPIAPERWYHCVPECGFIPALQNTNHKLNAFLGEHLLAFSINDLSSSDTRREAKRLMRYFIQHLLGDKPLKSRELFL